jgi:hypothetical protein
MQLPWPQSAVNWPISIGWGSMLIPPLYLSAINYKQSPNRFYAVCLCAAAWGACYLFTAAGANNNQFDHLSALFVYTSLTLLLVNLSQYKMAAIGAAMGVFGVLMYVNTGRYINTADHFAWRLAWDVFYALMLVPAAVECMTNDSKTQAQIDVSDSTDSAGLSKAA